jgi:hypothetical protein
LRYALVVVIAIVSRAVHAEPVDDLVARGETFGKQGEWSQAIGSFKAADKLVPRAKHACLIGLAYSRRELWAEAEVFFALCHQRATPSDPTPDWLAEAETLLAEKIAATQAAAVTFHVVPATATIAVSSFAPGETFASRTIHLAAGAHVITVAAPGYDPVKQEIIIGASAPRDVTIALHPTAPSSHVSLYLYIGAGVLAAAGLAVDELAVQPLRDNQFQYQRDAAATRFASRRDATYALFGGAVLAAAAGLVVQLVFDRPHAVRITPQVERGGAAVLLEWSP